MTDEIRVWYQNQYNPSTDKRPHHELARLLTDLGENRAPTTVSAKVKEGKRRPMTQLLQITPFHRRRMETRRLAPTLVQEPVGDGVRRSMRVGLDPSQRPALALFNRLMAVEKEVNEIISRGEVGEGREWEVETDLIRWMIREQIRMLDEEMVKQGWRGEGWTGRRFMEPRREGGREEGVEVEDEGEEGEEEEEEVKEETEEGHPGRGVEEAGKEKEGGPEDPRGLDTFLRVARIKSKFAAQASPEHNTALATTSRRLALAPCTSPDEDDDGGDVDGGEQATAALRQGRVEEVVGAGGGEKGGGGEGEVVETSETVLSGESALGEKSGESVLESALRLVGETSEAVGNGKARSRGKQKKKRKGWRGDGKRMDRNA